MNEEKTSFEPANQTLMGATIETRSSSSKDAINLVQILQDGFAKADQLLKSISTINLSIVQINKLANSIEEASETNSHLLKAAHEEFSVMTDEFNKVCDWVKELHHLVDWLNVVSIDLTFGNAQANPELAPYYPNAQGVINLITSAKNSNEKIQQAVFTVCDSIRAVSENLTSKSKLFNK